eukprot:4755807-Pyramimonas_sp.AAC.1
MSPKPDAWNSHPLSEALSTNNVPPLDFTPPPEEEVELAPRVVVVLVAVSWLFVSKKRSFTSPPFADSDPVVDPPP